MSEHKYLSDGRKVAVLGKLNNVESIVQEIFVTESGDEIPSGEKFTTKSLHDTPVESYAKKEAARQQKRLDEIRRNIEWAEAAYKKADEALKAKREFVSQALASINGLPTATFDVLTKFLSGRINWVVERGYGIYPPTPLIEAMSQTDNNYGRVRFEAIRLLTLVGKSNGDIGFNLSRYYDGSGGGYRDLLFFETYEEALDSIKNYALQNHASKRGLSLDDFTKCLEMGIRFESSIMTEYMERAESSLAERLSAIVDKGEKEKTEAIAKYNAQRAALALVEGE